MPRLFLPIPTSILGVISALGIGCGLVMDTDYGKFEAMDGGIEGLADAGGAGGADAGQNEAGSEGGCSPGLRINEIQTQGPKGANDEFIELYNVGHCPAWLLEYQLAYRFDSHAVDDKHFQLGAEGEFINPGEFLVFGGADFSAESDKTFPSDFALAASGGGLALLWFDNSVDKVGWGKAPDSHVSGSPAPAPQVGESIDRFPDGAGVGDNATDFHIATPTPGKSNKAP